MADILIKSGDPFILKTGIPNSRKFVEGAICACVGNIYQHTNYIDRVYLYNDPRKVIYGGYNTIYKNNIRSLTPEEVEIIMAPKSVILLKKGTTEIMPFNNNEEAKVWAAKIIQAKPATEFLIYQLAGGMKAKEIPVDFVDVSNL